VRTDNKFGKLARIAAAAIDAAIVLFFVDGSEICNSFIELVH
jgi:hypothetical protein